MVGSTFSAATALPRARALPRQAPGPRLAAHDWRSIDAAWIERWDDLAQDAAEPNPFYESWYLIPSLRIFDPHAEVELLCLESGGRLLGLLPLRRERSYYGHPVPHLRNWLHANIFLGCPLVARGYEAAFWAEVLAWCDRHPGLSLFLHLAQTPADGPLASALAHTLEQGHRSCSTVMREERALLRSGLTAEAYLERSLSAKRRKELRRQMRRLGEEGELAILRTSGDEDVEAWTEEFLALESAGWKGAAGSALECEFATRALFAEALAGAARRGRLERLAIRLDGKPMAMLASFLCPPGAFSYKTAFDEAFARYSPGVLLQCENLALLGNPAIAWTDSCAAADHPMIDHIWRERRTIARCNIAIGGTARRLLFRAIAARETGPGGRAPS